MGYKVVVTSDAENDLDQFIQYLLFKKKNFQAAQNVLNDFEATKKSLAQVAESLKIHVYKCWGTDVLIFCHIGILCYIE